MIKLILIRIKKTETVMNKNFSGECFVRIIRVLILIFVLIVPALVISQNKGKIEKSEFKKPQYRNLFKEGGYSQIEIDKKLAKAYYDVFEGPDKVYFKEGDSLGYVSDWICKQKVEKKLSYIFVIS
ncbi:hypothetical protein [Flavobacterium sp. LM4]|uniref:hypothetical protein n=1 Tax=Flavobacterium sp. LM4 TaxID=1938609 RepID=UPI001CB88FA5|nr:hypothetical protein [Flavobacterium sp. LM4]